MKLLLLLLVIFITSCANTHIPRDDFDADNQRVKIYSTESLLIAQTKANSLCGKRAFLNNLEYESNIKIMKTQPPFLKNFSNFIPFSCDVREAAEAGNPEAIVINEREIKQGYERLEKAKQHQYEVHKAYAKKHLGDSYSVVNPDGSIEAHYIDGNGNACHSNASQYGGETYCD